jgi:hypothetical protein
MIYGVNTNRNTNRQRVFNGLVKNINTNRIRITKSEELRKKDDILWEGCHPGKCVLLEFQYDHRAGRDLHVQHA